MKSNTLLDNVTFVLKCEGYESDDTGLYHSSSFGDVQYVIENILNLSFDCFSTLPHGHNSYRQGLSFNNIDVSFDGHSLNMGLCVCLSGNGCRAYEQYHSVMDLVRRVHEEEEAHFTRIDIACDEYAGLFNTSFILEQIESGHLRSRFLKVGFVGECNASGGKALAQTLYIGSAKSNIRFRIYDKAKEQGDFEGVWNRIECVFKKSRADAVAALLVQAGDAFGECVAELFNQQIQFINRDDSNIARCTVSPWWLDFIETVKKLKLSLPALPKSSVDRLYHHFENQAACLYVLSEALGADVWQSIYSRGKDKVRQRHRQMLEDYRALIVAQDRSKQMSALIGVLKQAVSA